MRLMFKRFLAFVLVIILVATIGACTITEEQSAEQLALEQLIGIYQGRYLSTDGYYWGITLDIYKSDNGFYEAVFDCYADSTETYFEPVSFNLGPASWKCSVSYDITTNKYSIDAITWIIHPPMIKRTYWIMDDLTDCELSSDGMTLSGRTDGVTERFEINRATDTEEIPTVLDDSQLVDYNRQQAVEYANTYGETHNPDYPYLTYKDDNGYVHEINCANFVSQCLYAGGLKPSRTWNINKGITKKGYTYKPTPAWGTADGLYHYLVDELGFKVSFLKQGQAESILLSGDIKQGDVIFFNNKAGIEASPGFMNHTSFLTSLEDGKIYMAGNASDYVHTSLSERLLEYSDMDIYIVHIS